MLNAKVKKGPARLDKSMRGIHVPGARPASAIPGQPILWLTPHELDEIRTRAEIARQVAHPKCSDIQALDNLFEKHLGQPDINPIRPIKVPSS